LRAEKAARLLTLQVKMKWVIRNFCAFGSSTSALEEAAGFYKPKWDPRRNGQLK